MKQRNTAVEREVHADKARGTDDALLDSLDHQRLLGRLLLRLARRRRRWRQLQLLDLQLDPLRVVVVLHRDRAAARVGCCGEPREGGGSRHCARAARQRQRRSAAPHRCLATSSSPMRACLSASSAAPPSATLESDSISPTVGSAVVVAASAASTASTTSWRSAVRGCCISAAGGCWRGRGGVRQWVACGAGAGESHKRARSCWLDSLLLCCAQVVASSNLCDLPCIIDLL